MVDVETDYLKPEFLYLLLFERCSVIIKPFLLPSKLEYLTILLDVFFRIDRYDTENADLFFEEENLDLLMENYASQKANIDILGEEKPPLLFFPQIVPEMHNALKKHPETPFLGVQSMNCDSTGIANEYERIAVFNKKRGAFEATKPKGIINSSQRNESLFEWCNNVAEMLKQKPEGNEVFEYLLGIQSASKELYFLIGGTFDEVAFYTLLKDFIKQERAVIVSLTESLYNLDLSSLLGNYEYLFQNVKDKIEHAPPEVKEITEGRNEDVEDYRSSDEWFFRNTEELSQELLQISNTTPDFFIAFQSVMGQINISRKISNPNKRYVFLRNTIWDKGIPEQELLKVLKLYFVEIGKKEDLKNGLKKRIQDIVRAISQFLVKKPNQERIFEKIKRDLTLLRVDGDKTIYGRLKPFDFRSHYKKNLSLIFKTLINSKEFWAKIEMEKANLLSLIDKKLNAV